MRSTRRRRQKGSLLPKNSAVLQPHLSPQDSLTNNQPSSRVHQVFAPAPPVQLYQRKPINRLLDKDTPFISPETGSNHEDLQTFTRKKDIIN
ncbi:hypothetical protein Plhal304r1_c005g0021211 [Plasmopara halstedii]